MQKLTPQLIASELVYVQPMTGQGQIFSLTLKDFNMMNIRQRSVNVSRLVLLEKLKANMALHKSEYSEALVECKVRLLADLKAATQKVAEVKDPLQLRDFKFRFRFQFPVDYTQEYADVIEMLELSVDENINLDAESFKAYIKNEWSWSKGFADTKALYASAGAFLG